MPCVSGLCACSQVVCPEGVAHTIAAQGAGRARVAGHTCLDILPQVAANCGSPNSLERPHPYLYLGLLCVLPGSRQDFRHMVVYGYMEANGHLNWHCVGGVHIPLSCMLPLIRFVL